jgi:Na+-driven multidrug efflux pump
LLSKYFQLGLNGIWISLPATSVIMSIIYLGLFLKGKWKTKKLISADEKIRATITREVKIDEIVALEN